MEIVSPANKDRPEHRRAFVAKCAALLQNRVSVAIVDLVTTRNCNLFGELLELIGEPDPSLVPEPPALYAVTCRSTRQGTTGLLDAWMHTLAVGQPLPTLPFPTPKAFHNKAQGRSRSERTLGFNRDDPTYPERVPQIDDSQLSDPFRVMFSDWSLPQGELASRATLGYGVQPLRGKRRAVTTWKCANLELLRKPDSRARTLAILTLLSRNCMSRLFLSC